MTTAFNRDLLTAIRAAMLLGHGVLVVAPIRHEDRRRWPIFVSAPALNKVAKIKEDALGDVVELLDRALVEEAKTIKIPHPNKWVGFQNSILLRSGEKVTVDGIAIKTLTAWLRAQGREVAGG